MVATKNPAADLELLKATVQATLDLTTKLLDTSLNADATINHEVNAIDLAHDTASLIRAHVTKLSLLIINKPFTPSAILKILRDLIAGPLPGLASSIELCHAAKYTKTVSSELTWRVKKLLRELLVFIKIIPLDGKVLSDDAKNGSGKVKGNGSLASTGVVWQACDGVIELKKIGIAGLLGKLAEEQRELIEDALWELQEWGESGSDADEDEDDFRSEDGNEQQKELENMFEIQKHIPTADPDSIRPRFEKATKSLKLVMLMYKAVVKRRFKTLPSLPYSTATAAEQKAHSGTDVVETVDTIMDALKKIPEDTDELASAFYSLQAADIDKAVEECLSTSHKVVKMLLTNWKGEDDEFTAWGTKFEEAMKKD